MIPGVLDYNGGPAARTPRDCDGLQHLQPAERTIEAMGAPGGPPGEHAGVGAIFDFDTVRRDRGSDCVGLGAAVDAEYAKGAGDGNCNGHSAECGGGVATGRGAFARRCLGAG
jgi:hypothetical protein